MFNNAARPKAIFSTWLHFQGKLLTTERLSRWGMEIDTKCCFCKIQKEKTRIQCEYASGLWNRVLGWLHRQMYEPINWEQH